MKDLEVLISNEDSSLSEYIESLTQSIEDNCTDCGGGDCPLFVNQQIDFKQD